jgi:HAD superfamily phosphoserine phosphatase-like hydrolase
MNISEVARHAGVSIATVSRVVNRTATVRSSTEARVREAIQALGYEPDPSARRLARRRASQAASRVADAAPVDRRSGAVARHAGPRRVLVASDFDQTLSFNDSGRVLCDMLGVARFDEKISALARSNLVQQGGELAYLLLHDPDLRGVRSEHLVEAGRRARLKSNVRPFANMLHAGLPGLRSEFYVISAAPEEIAQSALQGIVPRERVFGTRFECDPETGQIRGIARVPAGYGKVAVLEELQRRHGVPAGNVAYVGDGSSDIHVMLHVNQHHGLTIAASEAREVSQIARRTVLSDDALAYLVPILEELVGWTDRGRIRSLFEASGFTIDGWEQVRADWLVIRGGGPQEEEVVGAA